MKRIIPVFKFLLIFLLGISPNILVAEEATITGSAFYLQRIALPPNAVFEASLEDVSLMDVSAVVLGTVRIEPAGNSPITFTIQYKTDDIEPRHSYNVRGRITIDGKLKFITDTIHPVLIGKDSGDLRLKMIMVKSAGK